MNQVGIVSWGYGCASGLPGVYARVTSVLDFVQDYKTLGINGGGDYWYWYYDFYSEECAAIVDDACSDDPEVPLYDEHQGEGWCGGGNSEYIENTDSALECWNACGSTYGSALVAIDWWWYDGHYYGDYYGSGTAYCFCRDACECMQSVGSDAVLIVHHDFELPEECHYYGYYYGHYYNDDGVFGPVPIEGELTVGAAVTGDTSNAENIFGNPSNDNYFLFKPPSDDAYTFSTCGSKFDTYLRIFTTDGSGPHNVSYANQIESHDDTGDDMCTYDDASI